MFSKQFKQRAILSDFKVDIGSEIMRSKNYLYTPGEQAKYIGYLYEEFQGTICTVKANSGGKNKNYCKVEFQNGETHIILESALEKFSPEDGRDEVGELSNDKSKENQSQGS